MHESPLHPKQKRKSCVLKEILLHATILLCVAVQLWGSIFCFELLIGLLQITTVFLGNLMGNT